MGRNNDQDSGKDERELLEEAVKPEGIWHKEGTQNFG
jgi:hypothetical protein